jgi:hypothetical protein
MIDFDSRIANLDLRLFSEIPSQSTDQDKRSWLACQLAVREILPEYKYLEIGSYLGGSLQPYVRDPRCVRIYSIDKRSPSQPDERGFDWNYANNTTSRMLENLGKLEPLSVDKVVAIDGDTREMSADSCPEKVDICLIDGEHTDGAVMSDFRFCLSALDGRGAIMFDDAQIIYNGIADCITYLQEHSVAFNAYALPSKIFVIEIGDFPLHAHPEVHKLLVNNHEAYLFSLKDNDHYRRFANRKVFKLLRNFLLKARKSNVSY